MFVSDNASNNDTLATSLEIRLKGEGLFKDRQHRVRCFAHILNLVMQASSLSFLLLPCLTRFIRHFCMCFSKRRKGETAREVTAMSGRNLPMRSTSMTQWQAMTATTHVARVRRT